MKTITFKTIALVLLIALITICVLGFWKMECYNMARIEAEKQLQNTLGAKQDKSVSKDTFVLAENFQFQHFLDSIFKTKTNLVKMPTFNFQQKMNGAITTGQINVDSLKMEVANLASLVKILANRPIKAEVPKAELTKTELPEKTVHPYYSDVNIIFRTRNSFMTAKIKPQYKLELQYGQLFRFENALPEYLYNFTDKKGNSITPESAKEFLIKKSFYLNSVELKDNNAVVNCSIGI